MRDLLKALLIGTVAADENKGKTTTEFCSDEPDPQIGPQNFSLKQDHL